MRKSPKRPTRCQCTCSSPTKVCCRHIGWSGIVPLSKANATLALFRPTATLRHRIHRLLKRQPHPPRSQHQEVQAAYPRSRQQRLSKLLPRPRRPSLVPRHLPPRPRPLANPSLDQPLLSASLRSLPATHPFDSPPSLPLAPHLQWDLLVPSASLLVPRRRLLDRHRSSP